MCANYTYEPDPSELKKVYKNLTVDEASPFNEIKGSVFPFIYAPVIVAGPQGPQLTAKRYSLTPSWAKEPKVKWATYNARMNRPKKESKDLEYIYEVPTWREAFAKDHCLVPMNLFKESCHEGEAAGNIVQFTPKQDGLLFAAGIFSDWVDQQTGEIISTFAVVTTEPDEYIKGVGHDRSPVFLNAEDGLRWLDKFKNGKEAYAFLESKLIRPDFEYKIDRKLKSKSN